MFFLGQLICQFQNLGVGTHFFMWHMMQMCVPLSVILNDGEPRRKKTPPFLKIIRNGGFSQESTGSVSYL